MNFSVKALSKGGGRSGVLQVGASSLETPALLLSTRKGLPAFISPDLLSTLPSPDSRLLQFSPLHFVEGISLKAVSEMGGLHQMLGLKELVFAANPADPILSVPDHQSSNKIGASFETPSGRFLVYNLQFCALRHIELLVCDTVDNFEFWQIKPGQYMEMISSMRPDLWVTLADEVPAWVSDKRNKASIQRTMRWLDDCLTLAKTNDTGGAVFGSIVGGSKINERKYCAQEVSRRNVSGFHIGGFGLGESMDERPALLSAVIESLPEDKPRQISGLGLPEEVLQGVAAGIDLFNSTYVYHLTIGGFALTFPSEEIERHGSVDKLSDTIRDDGTKINLKATIYRLLFWSHDFLSNLTVFDICCMMKRLVDEWVQERHVSNSRGLQVLHVPESYKGFASLSIFLTRVYLISAVITLTIIWDSFARLETRLGKEHLRSFAKSLWNLDASMLHRLLLMLLLCVHDLHNMMQFSVPSTTGKMRGNVGEVFLFFVEHPARDSLLLQMRIR
ncbi:hypothetical protein SASPL_116433 [Salvia splendens]|uniref:tRNA-guanine(15) transglycosylase-like domain-containing protein n=1 Tax=Salvia splendens TaxID=180675 RepID=A0A8X8XTT9_SALSN|nr:hypothetical protein SASPL_116433 [Salvia splendens]